METIKEAWSGVLDYLRKQNDISEVSYDTWISRIEPRAIEDGDMVVFVHNNFQRNIIAEHYAEKLKSAFLNVLGIPLGLKILSGEDRNPSDGDSVSTPGNLFDGTTDKEYSFENFVVGSSNKFAYAASMAVASKPAKNYNPLFIYGGSGLGKTHLLYAICNEIRKNIPAANILYTKGEYIANELIEGIQKGQTKAFRDKYRQVDVLLVDDIQFISGKTSTQEEFFHTFDALHQAGKQIVLTSDRPPKEIAALEDRLRTRFEMGLIADIQPPEYETRVAIIKRKAESLSLNLSDDVIAYIATKLKNNVRELEGAVKKIKAYSLIFSDQPPSIGIIQNVIQSVIKENVNTTITPEMIVDHVSRYYNISKEDIYSAKRKAEILIARQVAMYITREMTDTSLSIIGDEFGGKNHSTVLHSIKVIEDKLETDSKFNQIIHEMMENIKKEF